MAPQREWFEKDYYKVLGVPETARRRRRSPRRTASSRASTTPTPTRATPTAEERFKEISAAYDVVGDEEKRKEYDEVRRLGPDGRRGFGGRCRRARAAGLHVQRRRRRPRRPARQPVRPRRARRRRRGRSAASGPQRGDDLEAELHAVVRRRRRTASPPRCNLTSDAACSTCHGTGAKPGTTPHDVPDVRRPRRPRRQPGLLLVQPRRAATAAARASSSTTRARRAAAPASSGGRAR